LSCLLRDAADASICAIRQNAASNLVLKGIIALTGLLTALAIGSVAAQAGHPVKGSWSGYWGPSEAQKHRILMVLDWRNNEIVGTFNPGPSAVKVEKATLDVATWTLTLEARMPTPSGGTARYVTTGKLENLGSWNNRRYSGTYEFGAERGAFVVALN
jgi:hypothetical protein